MSNPTEQELRAFVGPKSDYYLQKWHLALGDVEGAGNATGFNWPALLLSGLWLPYRKMYRATLIFFGVFLLETIFEEIIYVGLLGWPEAPAALGRFLGLVAGIVCGGFGNAWYLSHTQNAIDEIQSQRLPEDAYFKALTKRGGTSIAASLGFMLLFILAMGGILMLSELFLKRA